MRRLRSHPVNILENQSRYLFLLLLPVLRALLNTGDGLMAWLRGTWFDLLVLSVIVVLGLYQWYALVFSCDRRGVYCCRGLLFRRERLVLFEKFTVISVEHLWYYRPFSIVRIRLDTDGGSPRRADFAVTVKLAQAKKLADLAQKPLVSEGKVKRSYVPKNRSIAIFSFISSDTLTGALYAAAAISQVGTVLGEEFERLLLDQVTRYLQFFAFGLPPLAGILGYFILGCWLVSFFVNLVRHFRFQTTRAGEVLQVSSGIISLRRFAINVAGINYLMLRQTMLSKLFGFFSVFVHCTGYGKQKGELSVILPAGESRELRQNLSYLLPEIALAKRQIRPKGIYFLRFVLPPLYLIGGVLLGGWLLLYLLPNWDRLVRVLWIMAMLPSVWWLAVKIYAFFYTGIGVEGDVVTIYYTYAFKIITCSIPMHKISKIELSQSPFQRPTRCCDVKIYTRAEHIKRQRVAALYLPEVRELLRLFEEDITIVQTLEKE